MADEIINNNEEIEDNSEKIENLEKEKQKLLNKILSGNLETKFDKVGFILNNYSNARNCDIDLAWIYWETFESDIFNGDYITKDDFKKLTRFNSISRSRAKIQNDYKLFQADEKVKKYRGVLAEEMREEAISEKPENIPMFSIFIDETGKTQDFLTVGSLWIVDGLAWFKANRRIKEWIDEKGIDYEFHFTEVSQHKLDVYKEFFLKYIELNPTLGFKAIIMKKRGIRDINSAITDLTFHLIHKGIKHEDSTSRAPLPRLLQVWLDNEEEGIDQLKIENLKERITSQNMQDLYLGDFVAVDSKSNYSIQAVDLFTACINRRIHNPESQGRVKDDLANYILELLKFDINSIDLENTQTDRSKIFNLNI